MCYYLLERWVLRRYRHGMRWTLIVALMAFEIVRGWSQIIHTASFTRLLQEARVEYAEPTEAWFHVVLPPEHDYMKYDLVLENDRNDFEARYRIDSDASGEIEVPASVEVAALVASIASNAPESEIRIQIPPDSLLSQAFNAEKGTIAYFTPKPDFSEKPYGAMISLYHHTRRRITVVLLYYDPDYDPLQMYRSIRFKD